MRRTVRLKKRQQFSRVFQKGHSYGDRNLVLFVLSEPCPQLHVGFAVQRSVGSAVKRNRVRRRLRAMFAELADGVDACGSLVWLGKVPVLTIAWQELVNSGRRLLKKAGCLKTESQKL